METALHHHHRHLGQRADKEAASVPRYGRMSKMGNFLIWNTRSVAHLARQVAQTGAQDQSHRRPERDTLTNGGNGLHHLIVDRHDHSSLVLTPVLPPGYTPASSKYERDPAFPAPSATPCPCAA